MSKALQLFVKEQVSRLGGRGAVCNFGVGDTIVITYRISDEKGGERTQSMEGLCIGIRKRGLGGSFLIRRTAHGVTMERIFMFYSPLIESIKLTKKGKVRRAKLYYMRGRSGKMARVKSDTAYVGGARVAGTSTKTTEQ